MASAKTTEEKAPDPSPIFALIRRTRTLLRSSWVATGLGLTVGLLLGTLVAVAVADLVAPLATTLRAIGLALILVPAALALLLGVVVPLFRRLGAGQVARRIEAKLPGIHNRLVSTIDLSRPEKAPVRSPAFYARLVREALERIKAFRPASVVDWKRLRRAGLFAAVSVGAFLAALGVFSDRLPTAMARIFNPFADIPPATGVLFTVRPGDAKVLRGEDIPFEVTIDAGLPDDMRLELRPDDPAKETLWYDFERKDDKHFTLKLVGIEGSFQYRVHGGGTWSRRHAIALIERPAIVEVATVLHYPPYMRMPEPRVGPPQSADVTGPEGSTVEVVVTATGDVATGEVQLLDPKAKRVDVAEADRPERVWQLLEAVPEGAGAEGNWQWDYKLRGRPAHTDGAGNGQHGHQFVNAPAGFIVLPKENLFAYVYIPPDQKPEALMLQWHDGKDWEHRAYWGEDKFGAGKPDTPSRRRAGPMPAPGVWTRLEVPAEAVGMEGKDLRGLSFQVHNGQALWHRAGTVPPGYVEEREYAVATSFPMKPLADGRWSGRIPLDRDGSYRVELRNELGYANKAMKEAALVAIPDNPPQIVLERPGTDLVLSEPLKVPLVVSAYDDFCLDDVTVATQKGDSGGFIGRPIKKYEPVTRNDTIVASLDLKALDLKKGEHVRYRVETRDRKGQTAQSQEFIIRIADDGNAADKQLENFTKGQEGFQEKLAKLIAEQAKVQETLKALPAKFAPLKEKLDAAAKAEVRPAPEGTPKADAPPPAPQPDKPPANLDPEAAKMLDELRQEIAKAAGQEEQNANMAQQVAGDLKNAAEQAANLKMLPPQLLQEMQAARREFEQTAQAPLQDLAGALRQGADANKAAPNAEALRDAANQIQQNLEAMKARMEALARAQNALKSDAAAALEALRQERQEQEAGLSARDLQALRDFIAQMREELKRLEGDQGQLLDAAKNAPDLLLPDVAKKQDALDQDAENKIDEALALQDAQALKAMRRPEFPAAPHHPDAGEELMPPAEEDMPDEPAKGDAAKKDAGKAAEKAEAPEGEEELFMPALGGPRPKLDPRFANKVRPVPKKQADPAQGKAGAQHPDRGELHERGEHTQHELNMAEGSLASDQQTLEQMLQNLREAMAQPSQPHPEGPAHPPQGLDPLMQSEAFQQALAMAERMRQLRNGSARAKGQPHQAGAPHPGPSTGNLRGGPPAAANIEAALGKLDLNTRTVILKMPPKVREELLQGMREQGPEGYDKFIQDYFKRLTEVKAK